MAREREEEHGDYGKHASLAGHGQVSHRDGAEVTLHHKEQANAAGLDRYFTGLTAYDTQNIKDMYVASDDGTVAGRKSIIGALRLYLDFVNLFFMLIQLFGNRR